IARAGRYGGIPGEPPPAPRARGHRTILGLRSARPYRRQRIHRYRLLQAAAIDLQRLLPAEPRNSPGIRCLALLSQRDPLRERDRGHVRETLIRPTEGLGLRALAAHARDSGRQHPCLPGVHLRHADPTAAVRGAPMIAVFFTAVAQLLLLRSEEHTSELQSLTNLVCRLLLE